MRNRLLTAVLMLGLTACATLPSGKPTPGDPLERVNRSIWKFDNAFDHAIARPVAGGYLRVVPSPVRQGIHNFITNIEYPDTLVNDLLQGKFADTANDLARLVVNTTLGLGGLFDPASHMNLDRHDADLGQTFGIWGVHTGPFLMLPFLGPSDLRDAVGKVGDSYLMPYVYISNAYAEYGTYLVSKIDQRAGLMGQNQLIDSSYDSYAFVRNAYLSQRAFKVHGNQTETPEQLFPGLGNDNSSGPGGATGDQPPDGASASPAPPTPSGTPAQKASPAPNTAPPPPR
jgi:phospholipid-binding lipoprotein MlaA